MRDLRRGDADLAWPTCIIQRPEDDNGLEIGVVRGMLVVVDEGFKRSTSRGL